MVYLVMRYMLELHRRAELDGKRLTDEFELPYRGLQLFLGMKFETIHKLLSADEMGWFLRRLLRQRPTGSSRYQLTANEPLTPRDADGLRDALLRYGLQKDPIRAIQKILSRQLNEIWDYPVPSPRLSDHGIPPRLYTVQSVIFETLGACRDPKILSEIISLSDELEARITSSTFSVSEYFLREWGAVLGPIPTMAILVLRGFINVSVGDGRINDEIWMEGGLSELARLLGVPPRTLKHYFPPVIDRPDATAQIAPFTEPTLEHEEKFRSIMSEFIQRTAGKDGNPWLFKIATQEPLTEKDRDRRNETHRLIFNFVEKCHIGEFDREIVIKKIQELLEKNMSAKNGATQIPMSAKNGATADPLTDQLSSIGEHHGLPILLNILKGTKNDICLQAPTPNRGHAEIGDQWDIHTLSKKFRSTEKQRFLVETVREGWILVSRLLSTVSRKDGQGVSDPLSVALIRLERDPDHRGAGGAYDRLAQHPAGQLVALITRAVSGDQVNDANWRVVMEGTENAKLRRLLDLLVS